MSTLENNSSEMWKIGFVFLFAQRYYDHFSDLLWLSTTPFFPWYLHRVRLIRKIYFCFISAKVTWNFTIGTTCSGLISKENATMCSCIVTFYSTHHINHDVWYGQWAWGHLICFIRWTKLSFLFSSLNLFYSWDRNHNSVVRHKP